MGSVEAEAVGRLDGPAQRGQRPLRHGDDLPAGLAHQVVVQIVGQVVRGRPVAEVDVDDHAEISEGVEAAVDRRAVDVGVLSLDVSSQIFGGDVTRGVEQGGDDRPAGGGDPPPSLSEQAEDALESAFRHVSYSTCGADATCVQHFRAGRPL